MKKIMEEYKGLIINFMLAGFIVVFMSTVALPYIGNKTGELVVNNQYQSYVDAAKLKEIALLPKPTITYISENLWRAGEAVHPSQVYRALDSNARDLTFAVLSITNEAGDDLTAGYDRVNDVISFTQPGRYYFKVRAMDSQKKVTTEVIPIVIDTGISS